MKKSPQKKAPARAAAAKAAPRAPAAGKASAKAAPRFSVKLPGIWYSKAAARKAKNESGKSPAKMPSVVNSPVKKSPVKKGAPAKPVSKKPETKKAPVKKTAPVKKPVSKKPETKKAPVKKTAPAKKPVSKKPETKKAPVKPVSKKPETKKAPVKKTEVKAPVKKDAPKTEKKAEVKKVEKKTEVKKTEKKVEVKKVEKKAPVPVPEPVPAPVPPPAPEPVRETTEPEPAEVIEKIVPDVVLTPGQTTLPPEIVPLVPSMDDDDLFADPAAPAPQDAAAFTKKELAQQRAVLLAMRARHSGKAASLQAQSLTRPDEVNPEEDGTDASMRITEISKATIDEESVNAIDAALRAIDAGTYGVCQNCGKRIGKSRLRELPFAKNCIDCQSEMEREAARRRASPSSDYYS